MSSDKSSLRDVLSEKYDELEAQTTPVEETQVPDSTPTESSTDASQAVIDPPSQDIAESDSGRDPITGKFTKKQVKTQGPLEATSDTTQPAQDAGQPLEVPVSWRKDSAELFKKLPPAIQADIVAKEAKREQIWNQVQMERANFDKSYGQIAQVVQPYEKDWAKAGVTPAQVVNHLLTWNEDLKKDFTGTVLQMLQNRGMTPEDLVGQAEAAPQDPRIAQLEAKINELQGYVTNHEQVQTSGYIESVSRVVDNFANEKDATGQPKHPYFRELHDEGYLTPIAQTLREANPDRSEYEILSKAYEIAAYSNPKTRQALIESTQAKRVSEMKTRTLAAKTASSSVSGAPGVAVPTNGSPGRPLRDILSEKYDELSSGTSY